MIYLDKKKLINRTAFLGVFLFFFNLLAMKLHLYSGIWWLDIFMHLSGGVFLGFIYFLLFPFRKVNIKNTALVLIFVFFMGIFWEIFEIFFLNYIALNSFVFSDTLADLFFDLVGSLLAIFYFSKRIMIKKENII
jgi:hypothetical protein